MKRSQVQGKKRHYAQADPIKGALARRTETSPRTSTCDMEVATSSLARLRTRDQWFRLVLPHMRLSAMSWVSKCTKVRAPADKCPSDPSNEKGRNDSPEDKAAPLLVAPYAQHFIASRLLKATSIACAPSA
eukprot:6491927-Amphidinium_carterae.1